MPDYIVLMSQKGYSQHLVVNSYFLIQIRQSMMRQEEDGLV